jgi:ABC-type multidrug transport system fused ATPase/permease subunit
VIGSSASVALRNTLMCVGGIAMLVVTNPKLALWVLALVPIVVAPIIIFGRKVRKLSREAQARVADMVSEAARRSTPCAPSRPSPRKSRAGERFAQRTERRFDAAIARTGQRGLMTTLVIFIVFAAVGFLLWMGGQDVIAGEISARRPLGLRVLCRAGGDIRRRDQRDDRRPAARLGRGRAAGRAARRAAGHPRAGAAQGAAQAGAGRRGFR